MALNIRQILASRKGRLLFFGVGALVFFAVILVMTRSMFSRPPSPAENRLMHLDLLVKVVERYAQEHGVFPQPTVRAETPEGMQHVWGYELETPSLASCTVALDAEGNPDAANSHCGGDIYDVNGNIIGWKGTLTIESGMNNIELARKGGGGRVQNPVAEIIASVPMDPSYGARPALAAAGFGEYVYSVRMPEDSAENRGGMQYEIAITIEDPETGVRSTHIRGNFFVPSEERDQYPATLIGPGLLMDRFGNPVAGQSEALHVVVDGQREGLPHPALGQGEETLQRLMQERKVRRVQSAIGNRITILQDMEQIDSVATLIIALEEQKDIADGLAESFEGEDANPDVAYIEATLTDITQTLASIMQTFLESKRAEVEAVLQMAVEDSDTAETILRTALQNSIVAEDSILEARDEVLKYLDGAGIEEQSRNRAARKLQTILDDAPVIAERFASAGLPHPLPFMTKQNAADLMVLARGESAEDDAMEKEEMKGQTTVATLAQELSVHFADLTQIVSEIQQNLDNHSISSEEIDESLRKLSAALAEENERITQLFDAFAEGDQAAQLLARFQGNAKDDPLGAISDIAAEINVHGDFADLLFDPALLDSVALEQSPGIPDYDSFENDLEAEYKGIPYPLP